MSDDAMPTAPQTSSARTCRALHAYHVRRRDGLVKLDAMENPYRLPPDAARELGERLGARGDQPLSGRRRDAELQGARCAQRVERAGRAASWCSATAPTS